MDLRLTSRFYRNLGGFVILIVLSASLSGCNMPLVSAGTQPPQVSIQNATATRDPSTGVPIVSVDYTVKYPSDLYAQTLPSIPTLTCSMKQTQLTRDRSFTGAPASITGTTAAPQTGRVTIAVSEADKSIGGEFSVECTLNSDRPLATSNTITVNIPQPGLEEPTQAQSTTCQWQVAGTWNITQSNNYHPVFEITQTGSSLTGTATLSESEASAGGYTGTTGTGVGSVNGDVFTFTVTWPQKTDGQVISGTYTGTITEGRIDGQDNAWYGTGPGTCVNP